MSDATLGRSREIKYTLTGGVLRVEAVRRAWNKSTDTRSIVAEFDMVNDIEQLAIFATRGLADNVMKAFNAGNLARDAYEYEGKGIVHIFPKVLTMPKQAMGKLPKKLQELKTDIASTERGIERKRKAIERAETPDRKERLTVALQELEMDLEDLQEEFNEGLEEHAQKLEAEQEQANKEAIKS